MTKNASPDSTIIEATGYIFRKISICQSVTAVAHSTGFVNAPLSATANIAGWGVLRQR